MHTSDVRPACCLFFTIPHLITDSSPSGTPYVPVQRKAALSLLVLGLLALGVASEDVKHGGRVLLEEAQPPSARAERLEAALHSLEGKLHSAGLETAAEEDGRSVEDNLMMHVGSESTGDEEPIKLPDSDKIGEEWNAKDQEAYDNEMRRALGTTGYEPQTLGLPVGFLPIDNEEQEEKYAQILVSVMRNLKSGYWDELLAWADSGSTVCVMSHSLGLYAHRHMLLPTLCRVQ